MSAAITKPQRRADHALETIKAQQHADELLHLVRSGQLDAEGLARAIAPMYLLQLQALCRSVCKAVAPRGT